LQDNPKCGLSFGKRNEKVHWNYFNVHHHVVVNEKLSWFFFIS
jgi:hypothetical protein